MDNFKGVLWNREPIETLGGKIYRAIVAGLLTSDSPIDGIDGSDQIVDGFANGLNSILSSAAKRQSDIRVGSANDVLTSLQNL